MKKIFIFLSFLTFILFFPIHTHAEEYCDTLIKTGYTSDGIYYEVHGDSPIPRQRSENELAVTRTVTYNGKVTPQRQISWQESIDGIIYTGTLQLTRKDYYANTNITIAVYQGILTPKK